MWSVTRATRHTARAEGVEHAPAERAARARHLGAARLGREDRLEVGQRARARQVAVADRHAVGVEVVEQRRGQPQARGPQPAAAEVGREQLAAPAARQREPLARPAAAVRPHAVAQLHDPPLAAVVRPRAIPLGERRREVQAAAVRERQGGGEGGRVVDDEQVAGLEQAGEVAERVVRAGRPATRRAAVRRRARAAARRPPAARGARTRARRSSGGHGGRLVAPARRVAG